MLIAYNFELAEICVFEVVTFSGERFPFANTKVLCLGLDESGQCCPPQVGFCSAESSKNNRAFCSLGGRHSGVNSDPTVSIIQLSSDKGV